MGFAVESPSRRWISGVIPFVIHASIQNNANSRRIVQQAIAHWNANTCLQLVPRRRERDFAQFREHGSACASPVGRQGGRQLISCDVDSGNFGRGSVIHEIGHTAGLFHEQSRPDRDIYVVVSAAVLNNVNYRKRNGLMVGEYDCGSIMHYPPVANAMQPVPGLCVGMGQRSALSAGDLATIERIYRFLRRADSANLAGDVGEIALVNRAGTVVVTAVRTGGGRLRLISWQVNADGLVARMSDSGNAAGTASHIGIARATTSRFVVACRTGSGDLKLIAWTVDGAGAIARIGDSADQAGRATQIKIVALSAQLMLTACRTSSGRLRLITWRLNANGSLTRLQDSGNAAGAVGEVSVVALPGAFPRVVVTPVRTGAGILRLIAWRIASDGSINRRGDSGNAAGSATLIQSAVDGFRQVITACRTSSGRLRVIAWQVTGGGTQVMRLGDSGDQAGVIAANALAVHNTSRAISAVRRSNGDLRVIEWLLGQGGAVVRSGDSANQAGNASRIALNPMPTAGEPSVVSAVRTAEGRLRLISWERC